jgi:hypothetical protein
LSQLNAGQLWQRLEFNALGVPTFGNPFDPASIAVDATFTLPSGRKITTPAFWYQEYQRTPSGAAEADTPVGFPTWRIRFTPPEAGAYSLTVVVQTNGHFSSSTQAAFSVPTNAPNIRHGYAGLAPGHQYFQTGDGQPLRLIGENVCWYDNSTYDYDKWFSHMTNAGENYARIWMCPWAFGFEDTATSRTNYAQQPAWQLDTVLQEAEQRGIYILLCLDYHGMFATQPDYWGGNNLWPQNPYNAANGGPCADPNSFFTNTVAANIYQKRLRYLAARYGYSQNLLAWELFNEIDNDYAYLNPSDVASWHATMGAWLHTNDPFGHLVTTSLTGSSDRPEIWSLPQLDFAAYHSYAEASPSTKLSAIAQSFWQRYGKPVMIGEFGTDSTGWARANDPLLRGYRQGIWGGALGGSVGTAMSWWWQNIDSENDYPDYTALSAILSRTGWGVGAWTNIIFQTAGGAPPTVGALIPGGQPFNVTLPLSAGWGVMDSGALAVADNQAGGYSAPVLNAFVHGIWHADLKTPFQLNAWLTNNARLVLHLNSVSTGSIMAVNVDGKQVFSTNLVDLDGTYNVDEEYNTDIPVNLPSGQHTINVTNLGNDWFCLDWVRLENVLPAAYAAGWAPSPASIGLRGAHESLLYVVAPGVSFPANATTTNLPLQHTTSITLTNWPDGKFVAEWKDPATARSLGIVQAAAAHGGLTLPLPDFTEDVAGIVYSPPQLAPFSSASAGGFQFSFHSETGGQYEIQTSSNLWGWTPWLNVTNTNAAMQVTAPFWPATPGAFFRAQKIQ